MSGNRKLLPALIELKCHYLADVSNGVVSAYCCALSKENAVIGGGASNHNFDRSHDWALLPAFFFFIINSFMLFTLHFLEAPSIFEKHISMLYPVNVVIKKKKVYIKQHNGSGMPSSAICNKQ